MTEEIKQSFSIDASQALQAMARLDSAYKTHEESIRSLAATMQRFNGSTSAFANAATAGYSRVASSGVRSARTVRSAFDEVISVHGRYSTSLALLGRITFTQLAIRGLRLVTQSFREAIESAIAFQKQLAEIKSIDTEQIFGADLGDRLRGISSEFNIALPDVSKGAYEALSAQVLKSADDLSFLDAAAAFSKGSLTSMEASVSGLAGALNAYGQDVSQVNRLASQFNETINLGTLRGEDLARSYGTIATLGKTLGVSQAELLASIAALTNAGVPQAQAFTQVRGALTGLVKPTDALTKVMRENGFANAEQLLAAREWGGALKFLQEQTDGTTAGTAELFANQRGLLGVLSLGRTNADFYAEALERIDGVASSLNKDRAMQILATDAEQLTAKFNTLRNGLIPLGDGLVTFANTGLDSAGVLRDYSAGVLQFTGDLIRGKPAIDQFGNAWQNLQALFGKDLTIGESGGKIISEIEARQSQLAIIARRHEDDERTQNARLNQLGAERNQIKFKELDNFRDVNRDLQTEAQTAANKLIAAEKSKLGRLKQQIDATQNIIKSAPGRIQAITDRQEQRNFDTQTGDLAPAQESLAIFQRAQQQAAQAEAAIVRALRTGSEDDANRARSLFETAQATGEEAQQLSASAGDRRGALFAARELEAITTRQVAAERSLAASAKSRLPTLEQEQKAQQSKLDLITKATKELIKNSSLFDKQGEQLGPDELAKQESARQRAFAQLRTQGVSEDQIVDLQFRTDTSLEGLASKIQQTLSNIDAQPLQIAGTVISASVEPANAIANAYERAARASAQIQPVSIPGTIDPGPNAGPPAVPQAFGGLVRGFSDGGFVSRFDKDVKHFETGGFVPKYLDAGGFAARGTDTVPAMLTPGEFVVNRDSTSKFFSQIKAINAGHDPTPRGPAIDQSQHNIGDVSFNISGAQGPQATGREIIQMIRREQRRGSGNSLR